MGPWGKGTHTLECVGLFLGCWLPAVACLAVPGSFSSPNPNPGLHTVSSLPAGTDSSAEGSHPPQGTDSSSRRAAAAATLAAALKDALGASLVPHRAPFRVTYDSGRAIRMESSTFMVKKWLFTGERNRDRSGCGL